MEKAKQDVHNDSDFILYPNKVIGIIDDANDCNAAIQDLKAAGFAAKEIKVLTGEEGAHRLDPTGEAHGPVARFVRWVEKAGDFEAEHVSRHEQEVLAGHFAVGVDAREPESREKVREILKAHNGHFINFYGQWRLKF